jgi:hypothetical protein
MLLALIAYQMIGLVENALQHIFRWVAILTNRSGRIPSQRTLSSTVDAQGESIIPPLAANRATLSDYELTFLLLSAFDDRLQAIPLRDK